MANYTCLRMVFFKLLAGPKEYLQNSRALETSPEKEETGSLRLDKIEDT